MRHSTLTKNELQVHTVLRVVSDESVTTSMHFMKTMLEEAIKVAARFEQGSLGQGRQRVRCSRARTDSIAGDGNQSEDTAGGTQVEPSVLMRISLPSSPEGLKSHPQGIQRSMRVLVNLTGPSPGYCVTGYEQLCNLQPSAVSPSVIPSPPRKKREMPRETG